MPGSTTDDSGRNVKLALNPTTEYPKPSRLCAGWGHKWTHAEFWQRPIRPVHPPPRAYALDPTSHRPAFSPGCAL